MLACYPGTLILVSHDRDFLDRTVTSVIASGGDGRWIEYAGGYSDMVVQRGHGVGAQQGEAGGKERGEADGAGASPARAAQAAEPDRAARLEDVAGADRGAHRGNSQA